MTMGKKLTTNDFIERAVEVHGDRYDYSLVEYKDSKTKIKIICKDHGVFEQTPERHMNGHRCKACSYANSSSSKNKSVETFLEESNIKHEFRYDYSLVKYKNNYSHVKIICKEHGVFEQTPKAHIRGQGCNLCCRNRKITIKEFIIDAKKIHYNKYDYSKVNYKNSNTEIEIICHKHGVFTQKPQKHLSGQGCNLCYIEKKFLTTEEFIIKAEKIHKHIYDYSSVEYKDNRSLVKIKCEKHGEFFQTPENHLKGSGCQKCANSNISQDEKILLEFIKLEYKGKVLENNRKIIQPYELDIYLLDKNLAIEYCGLYWHSEIYKNKETHLNKLKLCQEKDIRLITIFEDEWIHRREQVKSKLKSILGIDDREKIYARKCKVVHLTSQQKSLFFEQNHIQGNGPGSISYGLEYSGEIVAAITFIDQKQGKFTLNRYATSKQVPGGFSKLLEHFKRNHEWNEIITFADLRWSEGELYEKCGFRLNKILKPDYCYIEGKNRIHKFNYRHSNLKNKLVNYIPNLSEKENCINNKISKIWDCGKYKFCLQKEITNV